MAQTGSKTKSSTLQVRSEPWDLSRLFCVFLVIASYACMTADIAIEIELVHGLYDCDNGMIEAPYEAYLSLPSLDMFSRTNSPSEPLFPNSFCKLHKNA